MQKIFFGVMALLLLTFIGRQILLSSKQEIKTEKTAHVSATPTGVPPQEKTSRTSSAIFVPYWSMTGQPLDDASYDTSIYFGVTGGLDGISKDEGFAKVDAFLASSQATKKLLTVRMLDSDVASKVLGNKALQRNIITQSLALSTEKGFDGIVLDLEISAIAFDSLVKQIRDFTKEYSIQADKNGQTFYVAVYGDNYYRSRPFDVTAIAKDADGIFIMAYDLHKAKGNPGPNFPLRGEEIYGYDFEHMIRDFSEHTPIDKITVIFGMFGYDWMLDDKHESVEIAKPLSFYQMKQKFLDVCSFTDCKVQRDTISSETKVTYKDAGKEHQVWFEDMKSVEKKKAYLRTKGISSIGFWAYSYF